MGGLAGALPGGISDPGFEDLLVRIEGSPLHPGNRVEVFFNGPDAFASMLEAVAAAHGEVLMETYILCDDATGRRFVEALSAAARRGVTVRVLADGFGSHALRPAFWDSSPGPESRPASITRWASRCEGCRSVITGRSWWSTGAWPSRAG